MTITFLLLIYYTRQTCTSLNQSCLLLCVPQSNSLLSIGLRLRTLQYLSFTRPDLSFAINKVYQFMHYPRVSLINRLSSVFYAIFITRLTLVSTFPHLLRLNLLPSQMPIGQGVQITANQLNGWFLCLFWLAPHFLGL